MLNAYIANGERCLVKEGYPSFGELKKDRRDSPVEETTECARIGETGIVEQRAKMVVYFM